MIVASPALIKTMNPESWDVLAEQSRDTRRIHEPGEPIAVLGGARLDVPAIEFEKKFLVIPTKP